jgi:hypothetical protein
MRILLTAALLGLAALALAADCFVGDGANVIFVDDQHDIVAVVRWIDGPKMKEFVRLLVDATGEPAN